MYWWNVSKLAEDLREGRVDEKERFKYFLATFAAWSVAGLLFFYSGGPFSTESLLSTAVNLTVAIIGVILCYRVNRSGDNTEFVGRMICLGWPIGVRLVVTFSAMFLLIGSITSMPEGADGPLPFLSTIPNKVREMWDRFLGLIVVASYFFDMYRYLAFVAKAQRVENALQTREIDWSTGEAALGVVVAVIGGIGVPVVLIWASGLIFNLGGPEILQSLLGLLAVGLWILLFGYIFTLLRRRSTKRV
jgi:hypothetical protein